MQTKQGTSSRRHFLGLASVVGGFFSVPFFAARAAHAESSGENQLGGNATELPAKEVSVYELAPVASGVLNAQYVYDASGNLIKQISYDNPDFSDALNQADGAK
jgi:hypothetical protein